MASKHHPNPARLLGYCVDMDVAKERMEQIVIYHLVHNGDLEKWVGTDAAKQLTLAQRMDAKQALETNDLSRLRDAQLHPPLPDDILLRVVRFAISCTLMPTATRPTMSQVCNELRAIRQECFGVEENIAAYKVDDKLRRQEAQASIPLEEQLDYINSIVSSTVYT
ncbi:unnamed protein product [Closterium sp. Naga37s-1]|nr:unnamed protein product [Closterium sp. Naga37s-1]